VNITVNPVNDPPVAKNGSVTTNENTTSQSFTLDASDVDGDTLTYTIVSGPSHGTLNGSGDSRTYTPATNYNGPDSFTYKANDGALDSNVATVSITVDPVNDAPVAVDDVGSTGEAAAVSNSFISQYASPKASKPTRLYRLNTAQRPYTFNQIGTNIAHPLNAIGYRSTDQSLYGYRITGALGILKIDPTTASATYLGNPTGLPASKSYFAGDVSPDGSTYYLYANKSGVLRVVDLDSFTASSVKLSSAINVADFAVSPTDAKLYGVSTQGTLLRIDPGTGQVTTISVPGLKAGIYGAAWFTGAGDLIAYQNGSSKVGGRVTWITNPTTTPRVASSQAGPYSFGNDGAAYVAPNWEGLSVVVDVLANDGNPAGALNRDALEIQIVQQPTNGTAIVNANKTVTYTSRSTYRGTDSFRYKVCDNGALGRCAIATVNITSAPVTGAAATPSQ
jgi:hypothetical protein